MKFCYKLLMCEFRHSYCSDNMFPNFAYARCATGFEPRSGKEVFCSPYLSRPALGLFSCDLMHWQSQAEKYKHGCLRELIIKGLKSVRMKSKERAHLINITNKTPDIRVTLKNRITCHPTIS